MHAPVLVTPPAITPVSLAEAKAHLRVDGNHEDGLITSLIEAAVSHLDGWTGIMGRCIEEQVWRQDFDWFDRCLRLQLWPVIAIESVTWRNSAGQLATVDSADYALLADVLGAYIRFKDAYSFPAGLYQVGALSVSYRAGYARTEPEEGTPASTVPAAIRSAILLMVGHWFHNREAVSEGGPVELPMSVNAMIAPYRRVGV